jgi:hypothetical protein
MNSVAALKAALAIAQVDREVSPEELNILDHLIALEHIDGWDKLEIKEHAGSKVDLRAAVDAIGDDVDRRYTLTLCFTMALAGGISPPEYALLRRIAAVWGYNDEVLTACHREGEVLYRRLQNASF